MKLIQTLEEIDQKLEETASDIRLISKSIMRYCNQSNVSFNLKNYKKELSSPVVHYNLLKKLFIDLRISRIFI